jgi:hypothetical protein
VRTLAARFRCCFFLPAAGDCGTVNSRLVDVEMLLEDDGLNVLHAFAAADAFHS